ncbi:MAG: type VI secretion system tube protein Hcp [Labilithrix sp.]|nr:type VI secretion system tube protein Hcp [Labilithrix sp.]MBX3222264.1 type VI secretion system tube protein Hcp [Labilithrix sp.]
MAEYGIVLAIEGIKGNCALKGYENNILVESVSFGSMSMRTGYGIKDRRLSIDQTPVTATISAGSWVAELQQACYISKNLKQAVLTQLAQGVDKKTTAEPTVVQKVTLTNPVIVSVDQSWTEHDGPRIVGVTFMFEKILFEIDKKPADFTVRNFTAGAV